MVSAAERQALALEAQREQARRSFIRFLQYVKVQSDDPHDVHPVRDFEPWDYLIERGRSWEQGNSEVVLKARQLGFSWLAAAFKYWRAAYHGWPCAYISKGQLEARQQIKRIRFIHDHLPEHIRGRLTTDAADVLSFEGYGQIQAFPSTPDAGVSFTFRLVFMDEIAFHQWGEANYTAIRPTISAGGQFIGQSTANPELGPHGFFHDMFWDSWRGQTPYTGVFVRWDARPERDAAWYAREKAAYTGLDEQFDAYYPESPETAFVGRQGLVYPTKPVLVTAHPWSWQNAQYRYAGVDLGGGDPTVAVPVSVSASRKFHQPGEAYWREPVSITAIGIYLHEWHQSAPFDAVFCPPEAATVIEELRAAGLPAYAADNRRDGILLVRAVYEQKRMTVHESCIDSMDEFAGYRWANRTDPNSKERYATSTPVDHHGDGHDARRYAMVPYLRSEIEAGRQQVPTEWDTGSLPETRAEKWMRNTSPRVEEPRTKMLRPWR